MKLSPIVLFVCNRPKHTHKVLSSLKKNKLYKKSNLVIFVDKPKHKKDAHLYDKVLSVIQSVKGFKNKKIILRKKNYGLAKSFTEGLTELFKKYDKAIILEDDNLVSPYFLDFMNSSLELYKNDKQVSCVYGYFPKTKIELPETFFLKGSWTFTWGTGIWRRSWKLFEPNPNILLSQIKNKKLINKFNFDNSFDWYSMLERCKNKQNESWSVRWYASTFLKNTLTLFPRRSLCKNIGMDGTGINTPKTKIWDVNIYKGKINVNRQKLEESIIAFNAVKIFFNLIEPRYKKYINYFKKKVILIFKS